MLLNCYYRTHLWEQIIKLPGFEKREHIAIITIPGFTTDDIGTDMFSYELAELCADIEMDEEVRVVIIASPEEKTPTKGRQQRNLCFRALKEKHRRYYPIFQNLLPVLTGQP